MDRIGRIKYMEQLFDTACDIIYYNCTPKAINVVQPLINELSEYYISGLWLSDYTADEQDEIPEYIKRGVLSQDGLYNLLCEYDILFKNLQKASSVDEDVKQNKVF